MLAVLAHQGGWDEVLVVLAPLVVFGGLLFVAKRRADAQLAQELEEHGTAEQEQP